MKRHGSTCQLTTEAVDYILSNRLGGDWLRFLRGRGGSLNGPVCPRRAEGGDANLTGPFRGGNGGGTERFGSSCIRLLTAIC